MGYIVIPKNEDYKLLRRFHYEVFILGYWKGSTNYQMDVIRLIDPRFNDPESLYDNSQRTVISRIEILQDFYLEDRNALIEIVKRHDGSSTVKAFCCSYLQTKKFTLEYAYENRPETLEANRTFIDLLYL